MQYKRFGETILLRLDPGEEIIKELEEIAQKENIKTAHFNGLGAINDFELGLFDTVNKEYHSNRYTGSYEISSLHGTITRQENLPYIHAHLNASDINNQVLGGHLGTAKVSATAEIIINIINGSVNRIFNEDIGLNLFDFDKKEEN